MEPQITASAHSSAESRGIPPLVVGTDSLGSVVPDALVPSAVRAPWLRYLDGVTEAGCTALDLAASYQLGGTERLVGDWMRARRNRDRLFLITKGALPIPVVRPHRLTAKDLADDLHASLRRLQTSHVDLYLVHRDAPGTPLAPILEALVGFQRAGKIAAYGVSNWSHARIAELDALAKAAGVPTLAASSPQFSLVDWVRPPWPGCVSIGGESQRDARAYYAARGLPVLAWSALGRGFFGAGGAAASATYGSPANEARRTRARELAVRRGCTAAQIALAYLFSQPFPVSAVVASRSVGTMRANLDATKLRLSTDDVRWLESGEGPSAQ